MIQFHHDNIHLFSPCAECLSVWQILMMTMIAFGFGYVSRYLGERDRLSGTGKGTK